MLRKNLIVASVFCLLTALPANAQTEADRIAELEAQVRNLTAQLALMQAQNETLLSQIAGIRGILGAAPEQAEATYTSPEDTEMLYCLERLDDVRRRKDRLVSIGFLDGHPDMQRLTAQLKDISNECDAIRQSQGR